LEYLVSGEVQAVLKAGRNGMSGLYFKLLMLDLLQLLNK